MVQFVTPAIFLPPPTLPVSDRKTPPSSTYSASTPQPSPFSASYTPIRLLGEGNHSQVWLVRSNSSPSSLVTALILHSSNCNRVVWCEKRGVPVPEDILHWEELQHANLVCLHQVYQEGNTWVLVLDFLDGYTPLSYHRRSTGDLPVPAVVQLVDLTCYLLSRGLSHRYISEQNLLYNPKTGALKLTHIGPSSPSLWGILLEIPGDAYLGPSRLFELRQLVSPLSCNLGYTMSCLRPRRRPFPLPSKCK